MSKVSATSRGHPSESALIRPKSELRLPKITYTASHNVQAVQGVACSLKTPYTGIQDDFCTATGVHPIHFQHAFIQTQSIGGKPPIPPKFFTGPRPTPQASPQGIFRGQRKRMARLEETCVNAHLLFLTNGCRLGGWELDGYALQ